MDTYAQSVSLDLVETLAGEFFNALKTQHHRGNPNTPSNRY